MILQTASDIHKSIGFPGLILGQVKPQVVRSSSRGFWRSTDRVAASAVITLRALMARMVKRVITGEKLQMPSKINQEMP